MIKDQLRDTLNKVKGQVESLLLDLENYQEDKIELENSKTITPVAEDFEELKSLLYSDSWKSAVEDFEICVSEEDKVERGIAIFDVSFGDNIHRKVLDFGCGEGHVIKNDHASVFELSVGYDIAKSGNLKWEEDNNNFLTTNFQKVVQNGTYDAIMLWDVLDHAKDPNSILRQIRQLCTKNTEIFVKCHPWCGVHGGHAYTKLNKAYAHLIFTDEELKLLGIDPVYTNKVISPMSTYRKYFKDNKFEVKSEYVERTSVDTIFKHNPLLKKRIMSIWKRDLNQEFPEFQMEQEFINYDIRLME